MIFRNLSQYFISVAPRLVNVSSKDLVRRFTTISRMDNNGPKVRGLLLGAFSIPEPPFVELNAVGQGSGQDLSSKVTDLLTRCGGFTKDIKKRLYYDLHKDFELVSVVDLGRKNLGINVLEAKDEKKENIRSAVAGGLKMLIDAGASEILIDLCCELESVAEAAHLIMYRYDELKSSALRKPKVKVELLAQPSMDLWQRGTIKADAQNFARDLMEAPSNFMRPVDFVRKVQEKIQGLNIKMIVRDKSWAEEKKMGSFLSVAKGSHEPPLLAELHYNGAGSEKPIVFVGKGITFDSGGISIKPSASMDKMRADMGGAAVVAATIYAAAALKLEVNIKGIMPLTENMPGGGATKPGDVVFAMNGTSIQVDNTDAEGRLILADGLCYAQTFQPEFILDIATLTGAMVIALGGAATGVFTNDNELYEILNKASVVTGDRVWRMPVFECYSKKLKNSPLADIKNISGCRSAGSCVAAAFLKEFIGSNKWLHLDIAGVMENEDDVPYLPKGMSGRPARTLIEFLSMLSGRRD